jgi:hypothetical protein
LKFLPVHRLSPQQAANLREVARREAECLAKLNHPGLMRSLDALTVDDPAHPEVDGAVVLVMERAARSLRDVIADATPGRPVADAHRLLLELAEALAALHAEGWVHGDVKPGNVLLMEDGSVRLADFGLSGELDGTHAYLPLLGSEDYLPPEWWTEHVSVDGMPARPSRDVWAFGVLAHQVLTGGQHPFPGASGRARSTAVRAYAHGQGDLRLGDAVPAAWQSIIPDCLAPTHAARAPHTAAGLVARVEAVDPSDDRPAGPTRPSRWRRRRLIGAAGAVSVVAVGGLAVATFVDGDASPPPTAPERPEFSGGELRDDAAVPAELQPMIVNAAHGCAEPEVTPALIAAMLKAESDFDPATRSPETDEYGIALWTPSVFEGWQVDVDGGGASVFSAADSIATLGKFLCSVGDRNRHIPGDHALVLAAVYRVGGDNVRAANGIPPQAQAYVDEVERYIDEYAEPPSGG